MTAHWRNRIVGYSDEPPDQLLANPSNWRIHPGSQQAALAGALSEVGLVQNVIVNKTTGHVVDGHLRITLALRQNQPLIPVTWVELSEDEERYILATIDPLAAMATADAAALDALLSSVNSGEAAVQAMLADLAKEAGLYGEPQGDDPGAQIDKAEELRQKWGTESGQLWALGEHRVICGDCTDAAVVARVMGGEKAGACVTDPPYGINLDLGWLSRANATANKPRNIAKSETVIGDDGSLDVSFIFDFPQWFVWGFPYLFHNDMTGWVVWDKWPGVDGGGLGNPVEMALSNCFTGFRLWRVMWGGYYRDKGEKREPHPTQKPMGVILPAVEITAGLVYDPFLGSGTTLIACERLGRRCRGIEISPAYIAVTLERWATMTGKTPELLP